MRLTPLYGCQPYGPHLENRTPCPVCRGNIRTGQPVYCEACGDCGVPGFRGRYIPPEAPAARRHRKGRAHLRGGIG